jgi:hypothetical protein
MSAERATSLAERAAPAIGDLKAIIGRHYPGTVFVVAHGDDPEGIYLKAIVDVDDVDGVLDQEVLDRLFDLQVEQELPLYLIPLQPTHRVLAAMERPAFLRSSQPAATASSGGELPRR